ncbi:hypothetical protein YC2023_027174 [Brassica napus]
MGNCCVRLGSKDGNPKTKHNPFFDEYTTTNISSGAGLKLSKLKDPTGRDISLVYDLGGELGSGQFGTTFLCTDIKTGEKYACKSLLKKNIKTARDMDDVRKEVEIMKRMPKHPNIVSIKDAFEDNKAVYIVMEICEGGELFDRIVARGQYTERAAAALIKTILEVVQTCHTNGVMHRDLKPENFLFANKKDNSPLKAIDFGLSVPFIPGERFSEIVGTLYYMAPEVLRQDYGPEVDIWSAGVILYIMLCGALPFWADTDRGVAQAIIRSVIDFNRDPWPKVSDTAKDLLRKMLEPDPGRRLSVAQVLEHPWIHKTNNAPNVSLGETVKARLKQFSAMNKLKTLALRVIADYMSVDELAGIKEAFEKMDINKRGKINLEELKIGLHHIGHQQIPDADLQILMEAAGVDGDGTINYGEFVAVSVHLQKMANDKHLHKAFRSFDKNLSGYIEMEELREALYDEVDTSSEEVIAAIMQDVDTDKDGRISYEEFAAMMKAGTDWRKASRQYSRERFKSLSEKLMRDGSL